MRRLKVGVIGAGAWGKNHVRTLAALAETELAGVCDIDPAVRDRIARQYPGTFVTDSVPAREHQECMNKSQAVLKAFHLAEKGL